MTQTAEPHVTLALTGDVMLGRLVNGGLHAFGPYYPWGNTLLLLREADLTVVNLECVIASTGRQWQRTPKTFHFRADPIAIHALKVAGIDVATLANNHVLDYELEAFLEMLERLETGGVVYAGAGRDLAEAARPAIVDVRGTRVGIVSFTDNEPDWAASPSRPGVNFLPIDPDHPSFRRLRDAIGVALRHADFVLASAHWGPNMRQRPRPGFRAFARAVLDAGADIFVGHSAHVFQGIEIHRGKPIIYDMGDFVDDYAVDPSLRNDQSLLYLITVSPHTVQSIEAVPVLIDHCQVNFAQGPDFDQIATRLRDLSAELGTEVRVVGRRLKVAGKMRAV